jgi:ribonuclease HII
MKYKAPDTLVAFEVEKHFYQSGYPTIAGVDEVGRGCVAGPVAAAAVILDPNQCPFADQIRDSKKISAKKRAALYPQIKAHALGYAIVMIEPRIIDQINILQASLLAMKQAIMQLSPSPSLCLVDGNQKLDMDIAQRTIIKGDDRVVSIGAASILAKVHRDQWMMEQDRLYPAYGFAQHKGYGTKLHRQAVQQHGLCPLHRKSFSFG